MSRINVIDPLYLTDQHLLAEYLELPMVIGFLKRSLKSKSGLPKSIDKYILNKGHVIFFYDKGAFLKRRYEALKAELQNRGFKLNLNRNLDFEIFQKNGLYNDWIPDTDALKVSQERITQRILLKDWWYKYWRVPLIKLDSDLYKSIVYPNKLWK